MTLDAYELCPCGSGKKLKFCCGAIVEEMGKVGRLRSSDQPRQALTAIEKLEKAHPDNPWVGTVHAEILLDLGEIEVAQERLERLAKLHPDHPLVLAQLATVLLHTRGYKAAQPTILRAFQKCFSRLPDQAGLLAFGLYEFMISRRHSMAARQYLTVAMRLLGEKVRDATFVLLLKLDGDSRIPYPLRSIHNLGTYPATGPNAAEAGKAAALVKIACFGPAGRTFAKIAELEPKNADLWRNVALCRAWDADEVGAAEAFHKAASISDNFEFAVECETLAQLLDLKHTTDPVLPVEIDFGIRSASRLLTSLEGNEQFIPIPIERQGEEEIPIAGRFLVIDRVLSKESLTADIPPTELPKIVGTLTLFDALPERGEEAVAALTGLGTPEFDACRKVFEDAAADEISKPGESTTVEPDVAEPTPREHLPYLRSPRINFLSTVPQRRKLRETWWKHLIDEIWWTAPQAALGGKSPSALMNDPRARVRLTAAVYVFDALSESLHGDLDFDTLLKRLQLQPLRTLEPTEAEPLSSLSPVQLQRLPLAALSDNQLANVFRRASVVGHRHLTARVLQEIVRRPQCLEQVGADRVYQGLIDMSRMDDRDDEAIAWAQKAKEHATTMPQSFERVCKWTLVEFMIRSDRPDDPELQPLWQQLTEYYAPKVPQIAAVLEDFVVRHGDQLPWLKSPQLLVGSGAGSGAAPIWTPGGTANPAAGSKKILAAGPGVTAMPGRFADDAAVMRRALELAARGIGIVEPNPAVGAVLVDDSLDLIAEGWHQRFGGPHAEIEAITRAGERAAGATLFVTLEPCCHQGKTGPCTEAIRQSGIRKVVAACRDPYASVDGKGFDVLRAAGIVVEQGLLSDEGSDLIAPFSKLVTRGRPWVHAKWAMSLDGKIATRTGDSRWISNEASRRRVHQLRGRVDAVVVGARTAALDDPLLTARPPGPRTPTRIVLASAANLAMESQLVRTAKETPLIVAASESAPLENIRRFEAAGVEVLQLPRRSAVAATHSPNEGIDLGPLLDELGRRFTNVLVEGGASVLGSFFDADQIDEYHVFLAPKIVGGDRSPGAVGGLGVEQLSGAAHLRVTFVEQLDGDVYVNARRRPE